MIDGHIQNSWVTNSTEELRKILKRDVHFASNPSTVKDLLNKEKVKISFGYRPSGIIHLGNINTFLLAAQTAIKVGTYKSTLIVANQDLDLMSNRKYLPNLGLSNKEKRSYNPIFKYARTENGNTHAQEYGQLIEDFLREMSEFAGIDIEINKMSEINRDEEFRGLVKKVCDRNDSITQFFEDDKAELIEQTKGGVLIYPIHPECKVTRWRGSKYNDGNITMEMPNLGEDLEFDIENTNYEFGVHFLLSPLRDLTQKYGADVHIHGGDRVDGENERFLKIQKTAAILDLVSDERNIPILTVGPTIYGENGSKMSKILDNGLTLQKIREINGKNTLNKLMEYSKYIIDSGLSAVDFSVTEERLLRK